MMGLLFVTQTFFRRNNTNGGGSKSFQSYRPKGLAKLRSIFITALRNQTLLKTLGGYSQISVMFLLRITSASRVKLPARHQCTRLFMAIGPWLILVAGNFAALTQKCRFSLIPVAMPISRCR